MVIGEPILDSYIFVRSMGKSAKENIVAFEEVARRVYRGGALIVLDHVKEFSRRACFRDEGQAPVVKERYVEHVFITKLFETVRFPIWNNLGAAPLPRDLDLVIVADYGHGLLQATDLEVCCSGGHFLALMVQSNSANWGFNLLTKWPRADYVVIDQEELHLASHDQFGAIETLARRQHERMGTRYFAVTMGHEGCLVLNGGEVVRAPAVAEHVKDRMGAGDAFLALTTPLAWAGAPAEVIATIGNIAGAIKIGKVGNQPVTRAEVEAWLEGQTG